jgi:hypothetical protein
MVSLKSPGISGEYLVADIGFEIHPIYVMSVCEGSCRCVVGMCADFSEYEGGGGAV